MKRKAVILIVDGESDTLDFFDIMMTKFGFEVIQASDGEKALEMVKNYQPDIIMVEAVLPKLSGLQVTKVLKKSEEYKEYRDIPVIMFSSVSDVKEKVEGYNIGVEDYILKPFNFVEVIARIRAVLRHRQLQRQIVAKEARISGMQSLYDSFVYLTQHLQSPLDAVKKGIDKVDANNVASVNNLLKLVKNEVLSFEAALAGINDEIEASSLDKIEETSDMIDELDDLYNKHLEMLQSQESK